MEPRKKSRKPAGAARADSTATAPARSRDAAARTGPAARTDPAARTTIATPTTTTGPAARADADAGVLAASVDIQPLTRERWPDLERLFGKNGACGGCWCMWWRQSRAEYRANSGDPNRRALEAIVESGTVPGLLAYGAGEPIGWVAVQPRSEYSALARSRTLAPIDDAPVWSVTCFFVAKRWRGRGLMRKLLDAAVAHARDQGATIVEGYPVESASALPAAFVYTGVPAVFEAGGFEEVARRSRTKPIYRRVLTPRRSARGTGRPTHP